MTFLVGFEMFSDGGLLDCFLGATFPFFLLRVTVVIADSLIHFVR
jgi:hypothetical protein